MTEAWDPLKAAANFKKHGIRFAEAVSALYDPLGIKLSELDSDGETRLVVLGTDDRGRILVVVYTHRGEIARLISARRATRREIAIYAKAI